MQFDGGARQGGDPSKRLVHHLGNAHDHLGNKRLYNGQGCGKKESHDEVEQKGGTGNGHKIGEEKIGGKRPECVPIWAAMERLAKVHRPRARRRHHTALRDVLGVTRNGGTRMGRKR